MESQREAKEEKMERRKTKGRNAQKGRGRPMDGASVGCRKWSEGKCCNTTTVCVLRAPTTFCSVTCCSNHAETLPSGEWLQRCLSVTGSRPLYNSSSYFRTPSSMTAYAFHHSIVSAAFCQYSNAFDRVIASISFWIKLSLSVQWKRDFKHKHAAHLLLLHNIE